MGLWESLIFISIQRHTCLLAFVQLNGGEIPESLDQFIPKSMVGGPSVSWGTVVQLLIESAGPFEKQLFSLHAESYILPTANENDILGIHCGMRDGKKCTE